MYYAVCAIDDSDGSSKCNWLYALGSISIFVNVVMAIIQVRAASLKCACTQHGWLQYSSQYYSVPYSKPCIPPNHWALPHAHSDAQLYAHTHTHTEFQSHARIPPLTPTRTVAVTVHIHTSTLTLPWHPHKQTGAHRHSVTHAHFPLPDPLISNFECVQCMATLRGGNPACLLTTEMVLSFGW